MKLPADSNATGRDLGREEIALLKEVIESGTLNATKGTMVKRFVKGFAEMYGVPFAHAVTSGTASLHTALAAINPDPGDEIITTPITDMGGIAPILYQNAIPVFADVDPVTLNITAEAIGPKITKRTKAIMVVHLFGKPADMDPIMAISKEHNIPVIEDCCQAYFAQYKGKNVGTIGDIGCFSLQQGKHMTTGEGGIIITKDPELERRIRLFIDKAWGYGDPKPDHYFLALNYRMTELQGAAALAQLAKVKNVVKRRRETALMLTERLKDTPGIALPESTRKSVHVFWKYPLIVDTGLFGVDVVRFSAMLKERDIFSAPRYIQKPAFMCEVLRDKRTYGKSRCPYNCPSRKNEKEIVYDIDEYPGTMKALERVLVLPWNEFYTGEHVDYIAENIKEVAKFYLSRKEKERV
ncbi:MAG: DegT/DnrJ/EryC1/StrS family aminotransferase [Candidatus Omnitrophota bacterium]|nr:MAG: DegT/DnrJ/EryC1/StrS family aminotransferase [Candidatus Omnitrophota bacterium]